MDETQNDDGRTPNRQRGGSDRTNGRREEDRRRPQNFQRKERSLSPYSKRLALTQAMNVSR
jgi:hypothetical protein